MRWTTHGLVTLVAGVLLGSSLASGYPDIVSIDLAPMPDYARVVQEIRDSLQYPRPVFEPDSAQTPEPTTKPTPEPGESAAPNPIADLQGDR